jgi:hypothetical protein
MTAHPAGAEALSVKRCSGERRERRAEMSDEMSEKMKGAAERAKQSAGRREEEVQAAGEHAEEVTHEVIVESGEKLAEEKAHRPQPPKMR